MVFILRSGAAADNTTAMPKAGQKRKLTGKVKDGNKKQKLAVSEEVNALDMTAIHPESYAVAQRCSLICVKIPCS